MSCVFQYIFRVSCYQFIAETENLLPHVSRQGILHNFHGDFLIIACQKTRLVRNRLQQRQRNFRPGTDRIRNQAAHLKRYPLMTHSKHGNQFFRCLLRPEQITFLPTLICKKIHYPFYCL